MTLTEEIVRASDRDLEEKVLRVVKTVQRKMSNISGQSLVDSNDMVDFLLDLQLLCYDICPSLLEDVVDPS